MSKKLPLPTHAPYFEKPLMRANEPIAANAPDAMVRLTAKLQGLENRSMDMKRANDYARKGDAVSLRKFGYSEEGIKKLLHPAEGESVGYSKTDFSKVYAAIRQVKSRIVELNSLAGRIAVRETTHRYMYQECLESCRILFTFSSKPQLWVRQLMSRHGFRFSSETNSWQRMLTQNAIFSANYLRKELDKENVNLFE